MELHQGIILGIVQGLTEFLPVSSSGHLVLGQAIFGMKESQLVFDISVHVGTLLAVCVVYFKDILNILSAVFHLMVDVFQGRSVNEKLENDKNLKFAAMIVVGSVPTALIGLALKKIEHILFTSTLLVSFMLILTGTILWISKRYYRNQDVEVEPYNLKQAGFIGVIQGFAVIPGISRSGSTIAAGMFMGMDRAGAAKFSFLLSIPAILGAELLGIKEMIETGTMIDSVTIVATLVSFVSGFIALKILIQLVHSGKFHLFAPYCWFIGCVVMLSNFM